MANPSPGKPGAATEMPPGAGAMNPLPFSPWQARGVEDVYYQREAQVTLWTILGGVSAGALLTQVPDVLAQAQAGRWWPVLYFVATALIIILSWVQTAWGALVISWPISISMGLYHFTVGLAESILGLQVTSPPGWMFASCVLVVAFLMSQFRHYRSGAWVVFGAAYATRLRAMVWTYGTFGVITLAAGLLLLRYPGPLHETVWGVIVVLMAVSALWLQDRAMTAERAALHIP